MRVYNIWEKESKMKKFFILLFAAFIAAGSLVFMGCSDDGGDSGGPTVTISGIPEIGQQLTAASTGEFQTDFQWGWMYPEGQGTAVYSMGNKGEISGPNKNTLTVLSGMVPGLRIVAERVDLTGEYIRSNVLIAR
jgi:hypothetical protein